MPPEHTVVTDKAFRSPGTGFFALVRCGSLLLLVTGLLLFGAAVIGFLAMLVRVGPTFVDSIQHLQQQMAGLVFLLSLIYLLIFPFIGLVGAVMAGIGFALGHARIPGKGKLMH